MRKATVVYTRRVGGTIYERSAWWGLDEDGRALMGPCPSRRAVCRGLAGVNRLVRSGQWAPRPLYTGYKRAGGRKARPEEGTMVYHGVAKRGRTIPAVWEGQARIEHVAQGAK